MTERVTWSSRADEGGRSTSRTPRSRAGPTTPTSLPPRLGSPAWRSSGPCAQSSPAIFGSAPRQHLPRPCLPRTDLHFLGAAATVIVRSRPIPPSRSRRSPVPPQNSANTRAGWGDAAQRADAPTAKACSDEACSSMPCTVSLSIALPPSMIEVTICPSLLRRVPLPLQSKVCSPPPPAAATREIATPPTALARTSSQCDGSSEPELKLSCVHTETGSVLAVACRCEKDRRCV